MRIEVSPQEGDRLGRLHAASPESQDDYLRGRFEWNKWSAEGLTRSVEYFQEATERDPANAEAWAGLSDSYAFLDIFGILPAQEALPRAKTAALKALDLDPQLPQAHVSLATAIMMAPGGNSWAEAENELRRAIALNSNNAMAHQYYGYLLAATARFDRAVSEMKRARELDPLSSNTQNSLGATYYFAGRYEEALQQFLEVPDPDLNSETRHRRMAVIYERKGMQKEAVAQWMTALRFGGKQKVAESVERTYASSGFAEAKKVFLRGDLREGRWLARQHQPVSAFWIASDYSLLGENDKAVEWIGQMVRNGDGSVAFLKVDPSFEPLRTDPRFQALLSRLGLRP